MNAKEIIKSKKIKQLIKILLFSIISLIVVIIVIKYNIKKIEKEEVENIKVELSKKPRETYPQTEAMWGELEIQSVKINANIYRGESDELLNHGLLHHKESYFPSDGGTILIVGTNKYLKNLSNVKVKDQITVKTLYGTYKYKVEKTEIKNAQKLGSELTVTNKEEKLILYTTYPDIPGYKSERFVVYASLVGDNK